MPSAVRGVTEKSSDHASIGVPASTTNGTDNCAKEGRYYSRTSQSIISSVSSMKSFEAGPRSTKHVSWPPEQSHNEIRSASTGRAVIQGSSEITTAMRFDINSQPH